MAKDYMGDFIFGDGENFTVESEDAVSSGNRNGQDGKRWGPYGPLDEEMPVAEVRTGRYGIKPGKVVNLFEVVGPHLKTGRYGPICNREYIVRCIAPTGPGGSACGKRMKATYHQIYYGSIYSCGCVPKVKHPPLRLEGQTIGRVEVLRWTTEYGGMWELVCHECGALLYRKTIHQVKASGESCLAHKREVAY